MGMDRMGGILTKGLAGGPACRSLVIGRFRLKWGIVVTNSAPANVAGAPMEPGTSNEILTNKAVPQYITKISITINGKTWDTSFLVKKHVTTASAIIQTLPKQLKHKFDVTILNIKKAYPLLSIANLKNAIPSAIVKNIRQAIPTIKIFNLNNRNINGKNNKKRDK